MISSSWGECSGTHLHPGYLARRVIERYPDTFSVLAQGEVGQLLVSGSA